MTTYNTQNPLGSTDPRDLYDNAENLDDAVNSSKDTFQDRLGKSRLTWTGIVKAGTGDAGVIVPVVQQAVQGVIDGVDGQVAVAESAADRAESAAEVAMAAGWVYTTVAEGEAVRADGEYFWVVSADDSGVLDLWLMGSTEATDTGKRTVSKFYLDDIEKNIGEVEENLGEVARKLGETEPDNITHGFVDADGRLLGYFNDDGEFECYPTDDVKDRVRLVKENPDGDFVYLLLDHEGRVLSSVDKNGRRSVGKYIEEADSNEDIIYAIIDEESRVLFGIDKNGNQLPKNRESVGSQIPNKTPLADITSSVSLRSFYQVIEKLDLKTTGMGRTGDEPVEINGDGLTHPKMVYVPQGWNGYKYWLAATPTFGVTPPAGGVYENPHVWASNDLETWVEPSGGRIDAPEDGNGSYWSDTHLALDDDGWMYCFYRGNGFSFGSRCVVAKRSRDGVSWSDRIMIYNANDGIVNYDSGLMSPAFFKNNSRWMCVDVVANTPGFPIPQTNYGGGRAVFKRASNNVASGYEEYDQSQIVNYLNREWGEEKEPWHIDAIQVGNLQLHLVNAVDVGLHTGQVLYLAWSNDGWNFNVLPRLETGPTFNIYRSSISVKEVRQDGIDFDVIVARRNGTMDLYNLTLGVN